MSAVKDDAGTPQRLHILLAMCYLAHHTGAELFTRDMALWLRRRGHSVTVFAGSFGEMAQELRHESIACIDDPALLTVRPDIVIGNTHQETVRAILQFPDVPAISICHDRSHDHGRPPHLSQIRRYVAVDDNCAERLRHESGIVSARLEVIQNGVDLQRFARRGPLPERPRRALVFSNYAEDDALLDEIRGACADAGIELDVAGVRVNNLIREPENLLGDYDLVFAKGRAATEALAVGCAVILLDHSQRSMDGMIVRANVEHARRWNFGRALLTRPIERNALAEEIARYDPAQSADVCLWVRENASLDVTAAAMERLAYDVIRADAHVVLTPDQRLDELRDYMIQWVRANHPTGEHALIAELRGVVAQQQSAIDRANAQTLHATSSVSRHETQAVAFRSQFEALQLQTSELLRRVDALKAENDALLAGNVTLDRQIERQHEILHEYAEHLRDAAQRESAALAEYSEHLRDATQRESAALAELASAQRLHDEEAQVHARIVADGGARERMLEERNRALLNSASWRITAPLRAVYSWLQKLW